MAYHYVRPGTSGGGTSWTDAYALPATLTRGDTYYLAGGSYGSLTLSAGSGTTVALVKKATVADHGTETGWSASYGTTPVTCSGIDFNASYITLDGVTGGGPGAWDTGHGIVAYGPGGEICIPASGTGNCILRHAKLYGSYNSHGACVKQTAGTITAYTFSYCQFSDIYDPHFHIGNWVNCIIEYCYIARNHSDPVEWHSEFLSPTAVVTNLTVRWSIFDQIEGTAVFAGINAGSYNQLKVYGNIFARHTTPFSINNSGTNSSTITNSYFLNNTLFALPEVSQGNIYAEAGSGNVAYNNVYYLNVANAFGWNTFSHNYTWAADNLRLEGGTFDRDADLISGEANGVNSAGSPFVSYNANPLLGDYHFATAKRSAGYNTNVILAANGVDMNGATRGGDGTWDRGAFEYGTSGTPPVGTPVLSVR